METSGQSVTESWAPGLDSRDLDATGHRVRSPFSGTRAAPQGVTMPRPHLQTSYPRSLFARNRKKTLPGDRRDSTVAGPEPGGEAFLDPGNKPGDQ